MIELDINKNLYGVEENMKLSLKLQIENGNFLALTGKSGSGKTTLLRILAGLEKSESFIKVDDEVWQDNKVFLSPQKRKIGFVFQDYALFPNMNVMQNLLYVKKDKLLANTLLEMTDLIKLKDRYPLTLSGGQKQRVALCRAMMNTPRLLLLDEALSALDFNIRQKLQNEIIKLHKKFNTTTIMVSHDSSEIYKLANSVIVLENGKIIKSGTPKDVLLRTKGSQKFSFEGEVLDIVQIDVIYVAIIAIGQQIVEVVLDEDEASSLKLGDVVSVSTKAFSPNITKAKV